jgi:hypothetical protein
LIGSADRGASSSRRRDEEYDNYVDASEDFMVVEEPDEVLDTTPVPSSPVEVANPKPSPIPSIHPRPNKSESPRPVKPAVAVTAAPANPVAVANIE